MPGIHEKINANKVNALIVKNFPWSQKFSHRKTFFKYHETVTGLV